MDTLSFKTVSVNKATAQKEWVVVDATDMVLGRLCTRVAKLLRGKYKPSFTPHVDCGDNVIIINADKVRLTGNTLLFFFQHLVILFKKPFGKSVRAYAAQTAAQQTRPVNGWIFGKFYR